MSGFMGKTKTVEQVPGDVKGLRGAAVDYLLNGGLGATQSQAGQVSIMGVEKCIHSCHGAVKLHITRSQLQSEGVVRVDCYW